MDKPNGLLKVVSILMIIFAVIGIVLGVLVSVLGGAVLGVAAESWGLGLVIGGALGVILLAGSIYDLIAGIMGVTGKYGACKVMGIIALVFAIIGAGADLFFTTNLRNAILSAVATLILPVLYVWGAFKGPNA